MRLATVLLKDHFPQPATIDFGKIASVKLTARQMQKYEGDYWNPVRAISAKVHVKDGALHFSRTEGAEGRELLPLGGAVFQVKVESDDTFLIKFVETASGLELQFTMDGSDPIVYQSYKPAPYTKDELAQFAGTFYSEELDSSFVLDAGPGGLTANNIRVGTVKFKPTNPDMFAGDKRFMAGIKFIRGKNRAITGFQVVVDEVRNLVFRKLRGSH